MQRVENEDIVEKLTDYIDHHALRVGDKLPSTLELAGLFGCSPSQVRTGLLHLETLGILEIRPRDGSFIKDIDPNVIVELFSHFLNQSTEKKTFGLLYVYELKTIIDKEIFKTATKARTMTELVELSDILKQQQACIEDVEEFVRKDEEFHEAVALITRNPLHKIMMEILHGMLRSHRVANSDLAARLKIIEDHRQLFEGIKMKDQAKVERIALVHSTRRTNTLVD